MKYLRSWYRVHRLESIAKRKNLLYGKSPSERAKAKHLSVSEGGILGFRRDEIVPKLFEIQSADDLLPYIDTIGVEPELVKKWRVEAEQQVKYPKILERYDSESSPEPFMDEVQMPNFLKRKKFPLVADGKRQLNFD